MRYAEVSVNSPAALRRTFSYSIPPGLHLQEGQAVWVPFGDKTLQGVVFTVTDTPAFEETRDITGLIEQEPVLSPAYLELASWISSHYLAPLFSVVSLMLPPGYDRQAVACLTAVLPEEYELSGLSPEQASVIEYLRNNGRSMLKNVEKHLGQQKTRRAVTSLIKKGLVRREYELEPFKVRTKTESRIITLIDRNEAAGVISRLKETKRTEKQAALLEFLFESGEALPIAELIRRSGVPRSTVNSLAKSGYIALEQVEVRRNPLASQAVNISFPLTLTTSQSAVYQEICGSIGQVKPGHPEVFLLHGVTGSGKTEIYLQCLAEAVRQGKRGIVLVPEISLTPQTIERFSSRFPGRVAVLHSRLSIGERYDEWQRIRRGEADVVIGPRSAVFAPQPDLGLIILDEEHEWTYKQQDSPRYHARDVAVQLAELRGATVVLGSATPDVESYHSAEEGHYRLLELSQRVTPFEGAPLPKVEVVDLRAELKSGNRSMFSRSLASAIRTALAGNEQVLLFLNRRGAATYIQCRDCGFVLRCKRCNVPLAYHLAEDLLVCHQCNRRSRSPERCPECGSRRIRYFGAGTQKLEQETAEAFPGARLLRWDSDTTVKKDSHREILEKFRNHEADILIGTQMITKGLDLPLVTLVGVVSADTALNLPDFRSGERTFQLLSQVAGRAGRGPRGGQVIIQTYTPEHYAIRAASHHDYLSLYKREIDYRKELNYPPFSRLASLVFTHGNDDTCRRAAEKMKAELSTRIDAAGISGMSLIGPAPAFIHRLRSRYRWQIIVRGNGLSGFLGEIVFPQGWTVDIDPVGLY